LRRQLQVRRSGPPFKKLQAEAGFDVLLPSPEPLFVNAKLCTPESSLFAGSPGISVGFYNVGFKQDVTNYNVLHVMAQKSLPFGGYVAAGFYHGFNETLFTNSDGKVVKTGGMIGAGSPDIQIGLKGLKKINVVGDVQTGKNVLGAWGFGPNIYFADNVSLLVGPVFFFDKNLQPGASKYMWTAQLDVDIPLGRGYATGWRGLKTPPYHVFKAGTAMLDIIFVTVTIAFFAISIGYVAACDRLMK
jgi:hypothetical protein